MEAADAIYARKSSDESDRQVKSIPDQLEQCRDLAKKLGITVKPEHEFVESKSAKKPGNRPVFLQLIEQVRKGKIKRILAWHPDRLSRNGPEGGMVTDLLDQGLLKDLKFCTFGFENNTAGKMMLGIMFVMSKEYSDRLSDNVKRGVASNLKQGKSVGTYKWGYQRNTNGFYEPHPRLYGYIKKAWEMRLNGKTFDEILKWLQIVGCARISKKGNVFRLNKKQILTYVFQDPIYYGVLKQKEEYVDLREVYGDFQPMISYEDWQKVQNTGRSAVLYTKRPLPLRGGLVRCACGCPCVTDVGKNYIYLICQARNRCPFGKPRIRCKDIKEAVFQNLKENFNPTTEQKQVLRKGYAKHVKRELAKSYDELRKKRKELNDAKHRAEEKLHTLIMGTIGKTLDDMERRIYEQEKTRYKEIVDKCNNDIAKIEKAKGLADFDFDAFSNFLETAADSWKDAFGESLHHMASFLFSNITVKAGTVQNMRYNRDIEDLFIPDVNNGGQYWT